MMWPITYGATVLYTKIFVVELQDIDANGGLRFSNLGMSLRAREKFRLVVFNFCSYGKYLLIGYACSLVGYRDATTDHTKHF